MDTREISGIYGYLTAWHYAAHLNAARIAHQAGQKHDSRACGFQH